MKVTQEIYPALAITEPCDDLAQAIHTQLIDKSQQAEIVTYCPSDAERRFADSEAMKRWSSKIGTVVLSYLTEDQDLAGVVFYRNRKHQHSTSTVTYATRIYDGYRGQGLAHEIMQRSHQWLFDMQRSRFENDGLDWVRRSSGVWLGVGQHNTRAQHVYQKFGYSVVGVDESEKKLIMEYY